MTEYHDEMHKWEHLSEIRIKFSEIILEYENLAFYKLVHNELKGLTKMNVILILSDSITYNKHIAITDTDTDTDITADWHDWFDKLAGKENTQNLRDLIWENKGSTAEFDTEKEVTNTLLNQNSHIKCLPIKSWFSTPIIWGKEADAKIVGSIIIYSKNKENNDKNLYDINFIEKFSKHLAILFKNKRIFDRREALVKTARKLYFHTKDAASFNEFINNVLADSYECAKELMNVNDFLAFIVPEKHLSTSSEPELYLSYKRGEKTENTRKEIFSALARYIIKHPHEKILLKNRIEVEKKLSNIYPDFKREGLILPESLVVVPMSLDSDEARGAFILYHMGHKNAYDKDDRDVIDRLSDQAALAIDKAHSQQLKDRTHRERHKALFDMNSVLFKFDTSHLKKDEAIQEVLKIAIKHIKKVGINVENVSMFTKHFQNRADLEDKTNRPDLQLIHNKGKFIANYCNNDSSFYIESAALQIINNPKKPIIFKNKQDFRENYLNVDDSKETPFYFLAVPMRLEEELASGAFIFCTDSQYLYDDDDLQFIDDITDSLALIIKNILMRIEKEKILFDMSRTLLDFVKKVGKESNEEIIEKILTTSCEHTQKLAKADNMMIYMSHVDEASNEKLSLQLKKAFENSIAVNLNDAKKLISIELIEYVVKHPKNPIIWGSIEDALEIIKDLNLSIKPNDIPKSLLIVPMSLEIDNPAKGAFVLYDFYSEHRYENEDKDFVDELSDQVAIIIQNLLLNHTKQELEVSNDKLTKSLIGFSRDLMSTINMPTDEVANRVRDLAGKIMDVNNMYIAYYDEKKQIIRFPLFYENGNKIKINERDYSEGGRTEWIIENNNSLIIHTKNESIQWYENSGFESVGNPLASWIGAPISFGDKIFGILAAFHPEKGNIYDEVDLKILESLANKIAITMENARIYKELQYATQRIADTQDILTKSLVANDLVHSLNNAAGTIPIWADLISDELGKETPSLQDITKYNQNVKDSVIELLLTVENFKHPEKNTKINVISMLDTISKHIRLQFYNKIQSNKLTITTNIERNLHEVYGLSSDIHHAIHNILSNGIEAILEKGNGSLIIEAKNISKQYIEIKVEDTGVGISSKNLKNIFKPYFSTKENGNGYGLWRTQFVIEKIGGNISVKAEENIGSIFTITIPTDTTTKNKKRSEIKNILVLDDQPQWRLVLSTFLKKEGHNVFEAKNIEDAKQLLLDNTIDLASIDLRLIDSDFYNVGGLELLNFIKENKPNIETIILTAYPEAIKNKETQENPKVTVLKKVPEGTPFDYIAYIDKVKKLLNTDTK